MITVSFTHTYLKHLRTLLNWLEEIYSSSSFRAYASSCFSYPVAEVHLIKNVTTHLHYRGYRDTTASFSSTSF